MISVFVKARLYTRRSLIEPEKSSPPGFPFQPIRRVALDKDKDAEMAYVEKAVDAYVDPSIYAVRVLVDDEPV
jgi:hypothetical protein